MNLVGHHLQAFVWRAEKRGFRGVENLGYRIERRDIPVQMGRYPMFQSAIRQNVFHAVGKTDHVRTYEFHPANVRRVKFRRSQVHYIPNKLHNRPPDTHSARIQRKFHRMHMWDFRQSFLANLSFGRPLPRAHEKLGTVTAQYFASPYVRSQSLADASSAASVPSAKTISPNNSMTFSVRDRNVASNRWEANVNIPNSDGRHH